MVTVTVDHHHDDTDCPSQQDDYDDEVFHDAIEPDVDDELDNLVIDPDEVHEFLTAEPTAEKCYFNTLVFAMLMIKGFGRHSGSQC